MTDSANEPKLLAWIVDDQSIRLGSKGLNSELIMLSSGYGYSICLLGGNHG